MECRPRQSSIQKAWQIPEPVRLGMQHSLAPHGCDRQTGRPAGERAGRPQRPDAPRGLQQQQARQWHLGFQLTLRAATQSACLVTW